MSLAAPEILTKRGYTYPIDWWSLVVCAFELLFECRPFRCVVRPCSLIRCVKFHQTNLCVHEMCQTVFACCCLVCVHEQLGQLADCLKSVFVARTRHRLYIHPGSPGALNAVQCVTVFGGIDKAQQARAVNKGVNLACRTYSY